VTYNLRKGEKFLLLPLTTLFGANLKTFQRCKSDCVRIPHQAHHQRLENKPTSERGLSMR